ncbi:hypothetical protein J8273_1877 [Carpediemonas membranifera]|uniref:Uncharacterized protein n=1 Tax=Carpediemonas membranifera TaxID=201153 RepID=A0A8J6E1V3_9EUKA|nr:hypothetical protein J8273_1877 [Carpediemonas membranifera]|eukprot:KAG9396834.1 hypothetical protein J8273_1877 [Carpediemonas membranifera]
MVEESQREAAKAQENGRTAPAPRFGLVKGDTEVEEEEEPDELEINTTDDQPDPVMESLAYFEAMSTMPKKRPLEEEAKFIRRVQAIVHSTTDTKMLKRLSPLLSSRRRALMMKDEDYTPATIHYFQNMVSKALAEKGTVPESYLESLELKAKIKGKKKASGPDNSGGGDGPRRGNSRKGNLNPN